MAKPSVTPAELGKFVFQDEIDLPSHHLVAVDTPPNVRGIGTRKVNGLVLDEYVQMGGYPNQKRYARCYHPETGAVRWYRCDPKEKR